MSDRRNWAAELPDIRQALALSTTAAIAKQYNTSAKTLRSASKRHGVSLRQVRRCGRPQKATDGMKVCRSVSGVVATYGADALAQLPDRCCRWPIGDPSQPTFRYCGAPRSSVLSSYCSEHRARSIMPFPAQLS